MVTSSVFYPDKCCFWIIFFLATALESHHDTTATYIEYISRTLDPFNMYCLLYSYVLLCQSFHWLIMFDTNENTVFPSLNSHTLPHRTSTWDQLEILSRFNLFQLLRSAVLRMCICVKFEHFNGACGVCPCDSEYKAAVCFRALGSPLKAVYCACLLVWLHTVIDDVWIW